MEEKFRVSWMKAMFKALVIFVVGTVALWVFISFITWDLTLFWERMYEVFKPAAGQSWSPIIRMSLLGWAVMGVFMASLDRITSYPGDE